ncbi:hypothetical protein TNCV_3605281 [Trichonephila clavipes]|uniref:Uncharacterized protein n=1 Tax=Trichonephila clavipes TaxID=2585209 RepID=A0A8X6V6M3_TRICX|nr:hypothetical protein TNCV_3605281 [Trichonephila clavipes]
MNEVKSALNGSQKRKIRKEKEYNINSKYAKLDNFLISSSTSSCASASNSNAREPNEKILEVNRTFQLIRILRIHHSVPPQVAMLGRVGNVTIRLKNSCNLFWNLN